MISRRVEMHAKPPDWPRVRSFLQPPLLSSSNVSLIRSVVSHCRDLPDPSQQITGKSSQPTVSSDRSAVRRYRTGGSGFRRPNAGVVPESVLLSHYTVYRSIEARAQHCRLRVRDRHKTGVGQAAWSLSPSKQSVASASASPSVSTSSTRAGYLRWK